MSLSKKVRNLFIFIFLAAVFFSLWRPVLTFAKETPEIPQEVEEASKNVVEVITSCVDDSGNTYYVHSGNGFVIGTDESEKYILTDYKLVTPSEEDYKQIRYGVGLSNEAILTTKIFLYFPSDITIEATITTASEQVGYALLKPSTPIGNIGSMALGTTSNISRKQQLFLVGYSGEFSLLGKDSITASDLETTECNVTAIERDPISLQIDGYFSAGKTGSPLMDSQGIVVGMVTYSEHDSLQVIPVEVLKNPLETLGITYSNTDPGSNYNIADKDIIEEFHNLLLTCQQDVTENSSRYSKGSLKKYKTAIQQAMEISKKENATRDEYEECIEALNKARRRLKPYNFTYYIIEFILLLLILFFLQLNIRQTLKGKKMKASLEPDIEKNRKQKHKQLAALIRLDTNEVIWLTKKGLRIGKNQKEVDYCIYNNPSVSRYHAAIIYKNEKFYIIDNHSTNKTCINNCYIEPEKACELFDEDSISIADIKFTFRDLINA